MILKRQIINENNEFDTSMPVDTVTKIIIIDFFFADHLVKSHTNPKVHIHAIIKKANRILLSLRGSA